MTKDRKKIIDDIARTERLIVDVRAGKQVFCPTCSDLLHFYGPKSGHHPGVFCGHGCTSILLDFR